MSIEYVENLTFNEFLQEIVLANKIGNDLIRETKQQQEAIKK